MSNKLEPKIDQLIASGKSCRTYFKENDTRTVIFGKFVALKDNEELRTKGYVRFVIGERIPNFEHSKEETEGYGHVKFTRIYSINDFSQIIES